MCFFHHFRNSHITLFWFKLHKLRYQSFLRLQKTKMDLGMKFALHYSIFSEYPFSIRKLQSVLYCYFIYLLKGGGKNNTGVSKYKYINQFVRPGGNYFWEYKRKFIYLFTKVSFVFHRMQPKAKL